MNVVVIGLAAVLAVLPAALAAQESAPVRPSDRLRFTAPGAGYDRPVTGTVVEVSGGDLHVALGRPNDPRALLVVVPVASITQLERSAGRGSRALQGTYGAVAGAGFGALAGVLQSRLQAHEVDNLGRPLDRESHVVETTLAGAAFGALIGVVLPGERWRPLGTSSAFTASAPSGRAGLGVRIAF
jgi:hypothetical protein